MEIDEWSLEMRGRAAGAQTNLFVEDAFAQRGKHTFKPLAKYMLS